MVTIHKKAESNSIDLPASCGPLTSNRPLKDTEAGDYLMARHGVRYSAAYLRCLRSKGGGPLFRKSGRFVVYAPQDLDNWVESRTQTKTSTAA